MSPNASLRALRSSLLATLLAGGMLRAAPSSAQEGPPPDRAGVWLGAGVVLASAFLLDEGIRTTAPPAGGTELTSLTDPLNRLGNPKYLVPALAAGYAGGRLAGSQGVASSSLHVFAALLASGVANGTLKYAVGRQRPAGGDATSFRPFAAENRWQSFPSGHAVVAFSIATSLSQEAGRPWVTVLSHATAGAVGWSRVYRDKHWTSDVVGGALLGHLSSRATLRLVHRLAPHGEGQPPVVSLSPNGVRVHIPIR